MSVSEQLKQAGRDRLRPPVDAVVTHHLDGFRSGVARFNELLAEHLGLPLLSLFDERVVSLANPLLSFKVAELRPDELDRLERLLERCDWRGELYLHGYADHPLERRLVTDALFVHCGNAEIAEFVRPFTEHVDTVWTPGLLIDDRVFEPAQISVFSFGMAHKIQTEMFRRLRDLLDAGKTSYAIYVSAANHETASLRDAEIVFHEMHEIFPRSLYFLGNLSDVAVVNRLRESTFFAAFFAGGARANNTSIASALERGAIVITNLDRFSPPEYVHMDNLIDINRCEVLPTDPLVLKQISVRAMETGRARGWGGLVERLQDGR